MLLHVPLVILATLLPIVGSDTVPRFDIAKECRYEGGAATDVDRCSRDESTALERLETEWTQFGGANKRACVGESTVGSFASYVELLTCLEMTGSVEKADRNARDLGAGTESSPPQLGRPGVTVGVGR